MSAKKEGSYYSRNREKSLAASRKWRTENRERVLLKNAEYAINNKDKRKAYNSLESTKKRMAIYRKTVLHEHIKKYSREYRRRRLSGDVEFKILSNCRTRLCKAVRGVSESEETKELLGCSVDNLKIHLENKFQDGMNWSNYGKRGWHIDHIKPCGAFDLTQKDQRSECFNYMNLQPLWASENHKKYNKYHD